MPVDYNKTLNLPKTDFPMRAGLPTREPEMLKSIYEKQVYENMIKRNGDKPLYILHDGPPYANGNIHMGTAMNKILKDFIVKYKNMSGFNAPYVPGWDMHGLPTETAIAKDKNIDRSKLSVPEFRDKCRDFAMNFVNIHREQFKRLGCLGEWENPYLTIAPEFEAEQIRVFGEMYKNGLVYKGLRPVYWCPTDETALAEAEIEYSDDECNSIYVKFKVEDDLGRLGEYKDSAYFVIWTTTTWTLPGNLAVCLNPDFEYSLCRTAGGEVYILASELAGAVMKKAGCEEYEVVGRYKGSELELMKAKHPLYDRESLVIVGGHVTLEAGTGCVHTAPGFGVEDFEVGKKYPQLGVTVPVGPKGYMTKEALQFEGLYYADSNAVIEKQLEEDGLLLASEKLVHSYPHCWRCRKPIIYRATEQWFVSVDDIKDKTVEAVRRIKWTPAWGEERMVGMVRERANWCISRQRNWGVPIPMFYCEKCGEPTLDEKSVEKIAGIFAVQGSNAWFSLPAGELADEGMVCPVCGGRHFTKETDIMDVWFDSGTTHMGVLEARDNLRRPADLYLEGGDQYRGWFQSSLLTSIATKGDAPYKQVVSHGWVVDGEGKKMSKSLGNTLDPMEVVSKYGADLMRLWVASADYQVDVRVSEDIFKQLSDQYLKIRNTSRYILGNLDGYDPDEPVPFEAMDELDRWALGRLNQLIRKVGEGYSDFEFHRISHAIHNFCVVDMSNFYLDVIKDKLYCENKDSTPRRSAQTAIYTILSAMVRMLAPILTFTAEEIWQAMPHGKGENGESVFYNDLQKPNPLHDMSTGFEEKWDKLLAVRTDMNKALEAARAEKLIGKPLEAKAAISAKGDKYSFLTSVSDILPALFIVSGVEIKDGEDGIEIQKAEGEKCVRCWAFSQSVGSSKEHPELCERCASVVSEVC
ncbi:MAG: isoleucine--tRNA ligase [Oscillospiraceae bacterium]|jgi:isoleucyl-tRNA synthetase|nr:isoleucine--tRNA ligase [Oscillospiraceae bacterium]